MKITSEKAIKLFSTGRFKAIIKKVGERRMMIGIERDRSSSKYREKFLCAPIDLDQLVRNYKRELQKQQSAAEQPAGDGGPTGDLSLIHI
jgi:hypothetical protein